jgi:DNA polymerase (family 10)
LTYRLFQTTAEKEFLETLPASYTHLKELSTEEDIFQTLGLPYIPPALRSDPTWIPKPTSLPKLIQPEDIRGIIHSHSRWSDGSNSIEEMAMEAIRCGYEYLVISDHSRSAFYANGLSIERIEQQHHEIDQLNKKIKQLHPEKSFTIFKSIEADILSDGQLDYPADILKTFDLVIASVHSQLNMSEEKAMTRLIQAIENPYTTILGHPTGRLLLSRKGYPIDHKKIIDACIANNVVIELNAHPRRLDIDWKWIPYVMDKGRCPGTGRIQGCPVWGDGGAERWTAGLPKPKLSTPERIFKTPSSLKEH